MCALHCSVPACRGLCEGGAAWSGCSCGLAMGLIERTGQGHEQTRHGVRAAPVVMSLNLPMACHYDFEFVYGLRLAVLSQAVQIAKCCSLSML